MEENFERRRIDVRDRDLIIPQGEYAFVLDKTKGIVGVWVGPYKASLAGTDQPVKYDDEKRQFVECDLQLAIKLFPLAKDGSYIVLENPAKVKDDKHPKEGSNGMEELDYGRKINIRGPVTFPLWPGQVANVIPGHNLKSNEFLLVRVYNEDEAIKNWTEAVIKPQTGISSEDADKNDKNDKNDPDKNRGNRGYGEANQGEEKEQKNDNLQTVKKPDLTTGKQLIIKGTKVSFYIPPTGIEVLPETDGNFVRKAVTLERLEYCILLDEDGNKRYVKGPAVVFPEPTEVFIVDNNSKKFKAIELNEISGIYVKVIADYKEDGKEFKVGEELFITGKDQMIYYPRPEHAIIKYGEQEKHFAVAIPAGEARYVLNRLTGDIILKKGPTMFLPDPRTEVIVRRVIDPKIAAIWFPGNEEAIDYNKRLMNITRSKTTEEFVTDREALMGLIEPKDFERGGASPFRFEEPKERFAGDVMERKTTFTPPRTITLDTKYSGAVSIDVWTGYAILVINKSGNRRVIVGPQTVLLEYDENLGIMELSTGKPKSDDKLIKTAYLRVTNNKVSDIVIVETKDLVKVEIRLSYRVNFIGEPEKWFDVENYVKLLTQHLRSVLRNAIKKKGIEEFYANSTDIIRDTILGVPKESGDRQGLIFKENGMQVYDVEVFDTKIIDETISYSLIKAQRDVVSQTLDLVAKRRELDITKEKESISQQISQLKNATKLEELKLRSLEIDEELKTDLKELGADLDENNKAIEVNNAKLKLEKDNADQELQIDAEKQKLELELIKAETDEVVNIFKAIQPELIATMKAISNQELGKILAENLPKAAGSFGLLTNRGGIDSLMKLVKDTPLEEGLKAFLGSYAEIDKNEKHEESENKN